MTRPIDEGRFAPIHGQDQWITLRGADIANPAILVLPGAGAGFSVFAPLFEPWQGDFTVVQWDQPGAGWTASRNGPGDGLSYDRLARDGLAVVEWVLGRLGQERLVVFCLSGGSVVGLKMIRARPELFAAYVAQGQITNWARQEALSYRMVLARARAAADAEAVRELEAQAPPPWADVRQDMARGLRANALTPAEAAAFAPIMARLQAPPADAPWIPKGLVRTDGQAAGLAAFAALKAELAAFDAEALGLDYEVPMVFFQGAQDAHTPAEQVAAYAARLRAPQVHLELIEEAGHSAVFLAERMAALLRAHVRPLTSGPRRSSPADR